MRTRPSRPLRAALLALLAATAALALAAGPASAKTVWLCRPGLAHNPCTPGLKTTRLTPTGTTVGVDNVRRDVHPKFDCFYVYPTVSDQRKPQADRTVDPEERAIALFQAARYSRDCRVYAPMYRQVTLQGLLAPDTVTAKQRTQGYADVRDAFRDYLAHDNHGRGIVFVGHSQGTFVLRALIANEVDRKPAVRRRMISALLLGGNVLVRKGSDRGGDFRNVRACHSSTQTGCVVAFSTFDDAVPSDSRFGRTTGFTRPGTKPPGRDMQVLCTNPAALRGGAARITPVFPSTPFPASTTIGGLTKAVGFPIPKVSTPWVSVPAAYTAHCSSGSAHVLQITGRNGAPKLKPVPDATWGLHLVDANIALGQLTDLVRTQARSYENP